MNWIQQNRFLTGLIVSFVILLGVFGFLLVQQQGAYAGVSEQFSKQSQEAKRLQGLKPYPDKKNLEAAKAEKENYKASVEKLQNELVATNLPLTPVPTEKFVEKLRDLNAAIVQAAQTNRVGLPQEFYMGFDKYRAGANPPLMATARLGQQLDAIDAVLQMLISKSVSEIRAVNRGEIPEEQSKQTPPELVTRTKFSVEFRADHEKARDVLNSVMQLKKPFLIIRNIKVVNDVVDTVPRAQPTPPPSGVVTDPGALPTPASPDSQVSIITLVGAEKVTVTLDIEMITFGTGPAAGAPAPKTPKEQPKKRR